MTSSATALTVFTAMTVLPSAFGFQGNQSTLTRTFDRTIVLTNSRIMVTVNFTNDPAGTCRGFFYSDQVPSELTVSTLSVMVNGKAVTNSLFESGQNGDVFPECTPYRWVLEQPTNFPQSNPVPPNQPVQITYAITSAVSNRFSLQQFSWVGFDVSATNASFGCSETTDQQTVIFTTTAAGVSLSGYNATNGFVLALAGVPETNYVIEASTNLFDWVSLVTNAAPFEFTDTNRAAFRHRFYRGRLF